MQPHQQRVVDEQKELHDRLIKLVEFVGSDIYQKLHSDEQERLLRQAVHMEKYLAVLEERIAAF
jgi:hypothetical protein